MTDNFCDYELMNSNDRNVRSLYKQKTFSRDYRRIAVKLLLGVTTFINIKYSHVFA